MYEELQPVEAKRQKFPPRYTARPDNRADVANTIKLTGQPGELAARQRALRLESLSPADATGLCGHRERERRARTSSSSFTVS